MSFLFFVLCFSDRAAGGYFGLSGVIYLFSYHRWV